jgi:hypothetical protein
MADNLQLSSADVTESGSLNLPEPSGPHRPVMGLLLTKGQEARWDLKETVRSGKEKNLFPSPGIEHMLPIVHLVAQP